MAFAAPAIPWIMGGAAALQGVSSYQDSQYQAAISMRNAQIMQNNAMTVKNNAAMEVHAANQDIIDKDLQARAELGELMASMDASGLNSGTGSMLLRRKSAEELATQDRQRLANKREVQLANRKKEEDDYISQSKAYKAEAKAHKRAGKLSLLTTALNVPTSYLQGASMLNQYKAGKLALLNPSHSS